MEPVSAAVTAITASTDITGVLDLVNGVAQAAGDGNYWWVISTVVYAAMELLKGRVPGTKISIPAIPALLSDHLTAETLKIISLVLSGVVASVFVFSGRPVEQAAADFAMGWLGSMGLHNAVGLKALFTKPKAE